MKGIIVGSSPYNQTISEYFAGKGYDLTVAEPAALRGLDGQVGDFSARLQQGEAEAAFAILTEEAGTAATEINGGRVHSLYAENKLSLLPKKEKTQPVVFLLDYAQESPMAATLTALADAKALAGKKRSVFYLDNFVRTAGYSGEALYKEARNAGVNFIKYESLDIRYDYDTDLFTIQVSDGVFEREIVTGTIFADGSRAVNASFQKAVKVLNLRADDKGYVTEDRYYLAPVFTSRRGVYYLGGDLAAERLRDGMKAILADVESACVDRGIKKPVIDGDKCVLCYNCYRACPHGALRPDTDARRMVNLTLACEGCGICESVCPGNAIQLDAADPAVKGGKSGKTLVLCCENSAEIAMGQVAAMMGEEAGGIELRSVACGGSVGFEDLSEALNAYGKVMVAVCMDDACRHINGNKLACRQADRFKAMLEKAGADPARVGYTQVSHAMPGLLRDTLSSFIRGDEA